MSKICFLYAGQGSQKAGMGADLYEAFPEFKQVIDSISLDFDLKELMFKGEDKELAKTRYTQPCMSAFAAGVTELLKEKGIRPDGALGLSLGEYGALYAAGVFDLSSYIAITAFRGKAMEEAAEGKSTVMSAVLGLDSAKVEEICRDTEGFVEVTNYNCAGQYVICGDEDAVKKAEEKLSEAGAKRCIRLNVTAPFHTKLLKEAGDKLKIYFENVKFAEPDITVALNLTGKLYKIGDDLKEIFAAQAQSAIHFEDCVKTMINDGFDRFIEIGPGNVLAGFVKKTAAALGTKSDIVSIQSREDVEKLIG